MHGNMKNRDAYSVPLDKYDLIPFSTNRNVVQEIKPPPIHDEGKC